MYITDHTSSHREKIGERLEERLLIVHRLHRPTTPECRRDLRELDGDLALAALLHGHRTVFRWPGWRRRRMGKWVIVADDHHGAPRNLVPCRFSVGRERVDQAPAHGAHGVVLRVWQLVRPTRGKELEREQRQPLTR